MAVPLKDIVSRCMERFQCQGLFREYSRELLKSTFVVDEEPYCCSLLIPVKGGSAARNLKQIISRQLGLVSSCPLPNDSNISLGVISSLCPDYIKKQLHYSTSTEVWLVGMVARRDVHGYQNLSPKNSITNTEIVFSDEDVYLVRSLKALPYCQIVLLHFPVEDDVDDCHVIIHDIQSLEDANKIITSVVKDSPRFDEVSLCTQDSIGAYFNLEIQGNYAVACFRR